jgi:hypothetical protein
LGGQRRFTGEISFLGLLEVSYRYRNLGEFDGKGYADDAETQGTPHDATGNSIDFDFSGIAVKAGMGLSL